MSEDTADPCENHVFFGGPIRTLRDGLSVVQAVGVRGDRIAATGSRSEVERALTTADGRRPRPFDLEGATLLPGLVDAHVHLEHLGRRLGLLDLDGVDSLAEACRLVGEAARGLPPGAPVRGGGWSKSRWGDRFPTRHDLDRVAPDRPVVLSSKDGHSWWLNSEALRQAGLARESLAPPGADIQRDAAGEPTGILREYGDFFAWDDSPDASSGGPAAAVAASAARLRLAVAEVHRRGLVGVHDMEGREALKGLQALAADDRLDLRVWVYVPGAALELLAGVGLESGFGGPYLRLAGLKVFLDGALGSESASLLEPYENSANLGLDQMSPEEFAAVVARASAERLAIAAHAIGDRAVRSAVDAFKAHQTVWQAAGLRHRIEHLQFGHPDDIRRYGRLGLVGSMQPIHAPSDRDMAERHWGPRRCASAYAWRTVADAGAVLAFGSDAPVETCDPLQGLYAAVTRRHPRDPGREPWCPELAVTPLEAVRAYTVGAAWAVGAERERGTIEPGRLADFTLLSEDILARPDEPSATGDILGRTRVLGTVVGGRLVYDGRTGTQASDAE
jgi:predicted amidohydrolase YtcJ